MSNNNLNFKNDNIFLKSTFCNIHFLEYEAKFIKILNQDTQISKCPMCQTEENFKVIEYENYNKTIQENEEHEYNQFLIEKSKIPKRALSVKVDFNKQNFKTFAKYLNETLIKNILITGHYGTGKTLFLTHLALKNLNYHPLFLSGDNICNISLNDFTIKDLIHDVENTGVLIVDEVQNLLNNPLFERIINIAYNNNARLVFCGNLSPITFKQLINKKIYSRFQDGGFDSLVFKGEDLRISNKNNKT